MHLVRSLCRTLALLALAAAPLVAQAPATTGRIVGRIIDANTGSGLSDAGIQIVGTTLGAMSGVDGRFSIVNAPAGTVTLQVRRIGYAAKSVTGLFLEAGKTLEQNISLTVASVQLTAQIVTAESERGSVNEALDKQKNSVNVVNAVTADQIAKSPDSDAAQAVQRVSGVNVQDGKYVFVRGLGDRYTQSSLNGARIPSPEPEKKVVPLDLFPAGLLQTITTTKTFTPDQPGDFAGAQVDIQTREFPAQRIWAASASSGFSDQVLGKSIPFAPMASGDFLAAGSTPRALPGFLRSFGNFLTTSPSQAQTNQFIGDFRNVWSPEVRNGGLNSSWSMSVGGNDKLLGRRIGYLLSSTYSYGQEAKGDLVRSLALARTDGNAEEVDKYVGESGKTSVLWGGLLNLSTLLGDRTKLNFNGTYNRTMDNEGRRETGFSENLATDLDIMRLRYVERSVYTSQLQLQGEPGERSKYELAVTASGVTRVEPDRSEFVRARFEGADGRLQPAAWFSASNEGAVRTFGDLTENAFEARAFWRHEFGEPGRSRAVKVGGLGRYTIRDAFNRAYAIAASGLDQSAREATPETIFDGRYSGATSSHFRVVPIGVGGSYDVTDQLGAAFAMTEMDLGSKFQLIGGARLERQAVVVTSEPTIGARVRTTPEFTDILPSIALTYRPTPSQNIRLSATQTVSRPEYRELAPIQYREVIGFDNVIGNEKLVRAKIQNYDARWEFYPNAGEVFSVGVFAKVFDDPIERVYRGSSGTRIITFLNADGATNLGLELEARKGLGFLAEALEQFTAFTNATVMQSQVKLQPGLAAVTNSERAMVGQAPYMLNAGLTFTSGSGSFSSTLLYNVVGRRITEAGELPLPDVEELERHVLDLSVRFPISRQWSGRIDARNLLDAPYKLVQGPVVRERYIVGRGISMGVSFKP